MQGNDMAFPVAAENAPNNCEQYGLTKREYFALHLMCALKTQCDPVTGNDAYTGEGAAKAAVACANFLIAELSK